MNRPSLHRFQHTADVIPCDGTGHIIESIYLRRSHSSAEVASRDPLAVAESQQNSQMTAETEACAGSDLRPVLHNEGRKNCRRQLAERSDASSAEVLSKLIQVATVIAKFCFPRIHVRCANTQQTPEPLIRVETGGAGDCA